MTVELSGKPEMTYIAFGKRLFGLCLLLLPAVVGAAPSIGQVSRMTGEQVGEAGPPGGNVRKLAQGAPVFAGERVRTGDGTSLHIEFTDKTRFILGPNAEFEVHKYSYAGQGAAEDAFHSRIIKGAFRFVSGLIARSKGRNMQVNAGVVATIGIRGTHVEGEVTERRERDGVTIDSSAKVMLLEPEGSDKKSAIEVSNQYGSVVIDKPGYGTEIPDERSPPSPIRKMQLRTIDNLQRALRSPVRQGGPMRRP
jgi:FecR protein